MKKAATYIATFGILALLGAGCAGGGTPTNNTTTNNNGGTTTTPTTTTSTGQNQSGFTVQVSPLGNRLVQVNWTAPSDVDQNSRIRVLRSERAGSNNPYWNQFLPTTSTVQVRAATTGTWYFKVCEFKDDQYGRCSEEVQTQVN